MILTTYSEEEIIVELQRDYSWVKQFLQKEKKVLLKKWRKAGFGKDIRKSHYELTTPDNNKYYACLHLNLKKPADSHYHMHCVVESSYGTLDYFILRGLSFGGCYYIQITSHAIKRIRERMPSLAMLNAHEICSMIFQRRECGSALQLVDIDFLPIVDSIKNKKEITLLVTTYLGVFFAYHTPGNNILFKTFISKDMINEGVERDVYEYCIAGHKLLNQKNPYSDDYSKELAKFEEFKHKYKVSMCGITLDP